METTQSTARPPDQIGNHEAQSAGAQGAGKSEENEHIVGQHAQPEAMGGSQTAPLERDALHAAEDLLGGNTGLDAERLHGSSEETRLGRLPGSVRHAFCSVLEPALQVREQRKGIHRRRPVQIEGADALRDSGNGRRRLPEQAELRGCRVRWCVERGPPVA